MRAHLLEEWRATAGDPDWAVTRWLTADGVPTGLRRHPGDCGTYRKNGRFCRSAIGKMSHRDLRTPLAD